MHSLIVVLWDRKATNSERLYNVGETRGLSLAGHAQIHSAQMAEKRAFGSFTVYISFALNSPLPPRSGTPYQLHFCRKPRVPLPYQRHAVGKPDGREPLNWFTKVHAGKHRGIRVNLAAEAGLGSASTRQLPIGQLDHTCSRESNPSEQRPEASSQQATNPKPNPAPTCKHGVQSSPPPLTPLRRWG